MSGPLLDAAALRAAGRAPTLPFTVALRDGRLLTVSRLLRLLPGKRIVGEGVLGESRVLAKLFVADASERHWAQECRGIESLVARDIPTPQVLLAEPLPAGGHLVLTEFLAEAESLSAQWAQLGAPTPGEAAALAVLQPALAMLARLHRAGLAQKDLHLGNFLRLADHLFVIDGDSVTAAEPPLSPASAAANLGMLLAQLPAAWDTEGRHLLEIYRAAGGATIDESTLAREVDRVREWRLKDYLGKCVRDCTLFSVEQGATRFTSVLRTEAGRLAALIDDPDRVLAAGRRLKSGNTCTVAQATAGDGEVVIKRYNLKGLGHALSRAWRPSRAWHSWREGHRLQLLGIATPAPLALIEERFGPLRRRAWLVADHCPGASLADHLAADREPPAAEAAALTTLFATLHRLRISHGDLKASNLLWHAERIWLIDLDACTQHRTDAAFRKTWQRDRARLLRNWPADSMLGRWLDRVLPPV